MPILLLVLCYSSPLSAGLVDPGQVLGGRVDGQALPDDVLALLHQTLPLALPWDRAWLASLQVPKHPSRFSKALVKRRFTPTPKPNTSTLKQAHKAQGCGS